MQRFSSYTLPQLKSYCLEHSIVVTGDKRKRDTYLESIQHHNVHNADRVSTPEVTTFRADYDANTDTTTISTTGTNKSNWLSEALATEPTPEDLILYAKADSREVTPTPEVEQPTQVSVSTPAIAAYTPMLILLAPILILFLVVELLLRFSKPTLSLLSKLSLPTTENIPPVLRRSRQKRSVPIGAVVG